MTKVEGYKQWNTLKCRLAVKNGLTAKEVESNNTMIREDENGN